MSTEELPEVVRAALDAVPWEAERYSCDDCESRGGHPWEGQSVWLAPLGGAVLLLEGGGGVGGGGGQGGGEPYPPVWHDEAAVLAWPASLLFYVWNLAVSGEPPSARPKGSSR